MTKQPEQPRSEQEWLGNPPRLEDAILKTVLGQPLNESQRTVLDEAMNHLSPTKRRRPWIAEEHFFSYRPPAPRKGLHEEAEAHAVHGVKALENGELDAGIAWLQSALAFAQNARHLRDVEASA